MIKKAQIKNTKATAALIAAPVLWGGALIAGKIISAEIPPVSASFIRFVIASAALALYMKTREGSLPRPDKKILPVLILAGLTGVALFSIFLFSGLARISAGRSAVILATTPAVVALFSAVRYKEKQSILFAVAIFMAFAGAALVISQGNLLSLLTVPPGPGDLFLIGCVICWAIYSFAGKAVMDSISPLAAIMYTSFFGALILAVPAFLEGGLPLLFHSSVKVWASFLYMGVVTSGIAHTCYYYGIREIGTSRSAIFMNLEPISVLLLGTLFLGEIITLPLAAGAVLVLLGVSISAWK